MILTVWPASCFSQVAGLVGMRTPCSSASFEGRGGSTASAIKERVGTALRIGMGLEEPNPGDASADQQMIQRFVDDREIGFGPQ